MTEAAKDTQRAMVAARAICDGRDVRSNMQVLITLDHTIATVLLAAMGGDAKKAVAMLNEAVIPDVEERIMLYGKHTP